MAFYYSVHLYAEEVSLCHTQKSLPPPPNRLLLIVDDLTVMLLAVAPMIPTMTPTMRRPPVRRILKLLVILKIIGASNRVRLQMLPTRVVASALFTQLRQLVRFPVIASECRIALRSHIVVQFSRLIQIAGEVHLRLGRVLVLRQTVSRAVLDLEAGSILRHHFAFRVLDQPFAAVARPRIGARTSHSAVARCALLFLHFVLIVHIATVAVMLLLMVTRRRRPRTPAIRIATTSTASTIARVRRVPTVHPWRRRLIVIRRLIITRHRWRWHDAASIGTLLLAECFLAAARRHHRAARDERPTLRAYALLGARVRHVNHLPAAFRAGAVAALAQLCVHDACLADAIVTVPLSPILATLSDGGLVTLARLDDVAAGTVYVGAQAEFAAGGAGRVLGVVRVQINVVHIVGGDIGGNVNVIGVVQDVGEPNDGRDVATGFDARLRKASGKLSFPI